MEGKIFLINKKNIFTFAFFVLYPLVLNEIKIYYIYLLK